MTNEERDNILDQHKTIYDGYVTSYAQQPKEQPLYTQDFANDKQGITVSNKGVVTAYKNMGINEMRYDHKSTGLFADEENGFKENLEGFITIGKGLLYFLPFFLFFGKNIDFFLFCFVVLDCYCLPVNCYSMIDVTKQTVKNIIKCPYL